MSLLKSLAKRLRQVALSFREKPASKVDDYVLEHFLLYHGLVGTSPENQKNFREVKEDIHQAVANVSSLQLGISMKLPPLWWDEKLQSIFSEIAEQDQVNRCLLPQLDDTTWPNDSDPLGHPDWRVRANAARMCAFMKILPADERMQRSLLDSSENAKPAFCHLAYALGSLGTDRARAALKEFIDTDEPWFRVDVAGALASAKNRDDLQDLAGALFSRHALLDYSAVVVAKHRSLEEFLEHPEALVQDGGFALVLHMVQATTQTFDDNLLLDSNIPSQLNRMVELTNEATSPLRVRALLKLADWTDAHERREDQAVAAALECISSAKTKELIVASVASSATNQQLSNHQDINLRSALLLAGELHLQDAFDSLVARLNEKSAYIEETIESLRNLGNVKAAAPLIKMSKSLVNVQERSERAPSSQPVFEENEVDAKLYWLILKALGNLPTSDTVAYLKSASQDFAPDKREQAISALVSCCSLDQKIDRAPVVELLIKGVGDPNAAVRCASLKGAGELRLFDLLGLIIDCLNARETSVSKQSQAAISYLWGDNKERVRTELKQRIAAENDSFRRKNLEDVLSLHDST